MTTPFAAHPLIGNFVTQPLTRAAQHFDVLRHKACLFLKLAKHRLLGGFATLNAALRELP